MAPINDHKTTELIARSSTPRPAAIRPNSQAPIMNPIAMNRPCGEIANVEPKRNRSRTGHPTLARTAAADIGREPSSGPRYVRRRAATRGRPRVRSAAR